MNRPVYAGSEGHRARLREKYRKGGLDGFLDYECLELLLTFAIQRKDVKPIAKALIERFGSFPNVLDASLTDLSEVEGLGANSALLVKLVRDMTVCYLAQKIDGLTFLNHVEQFTDYARMRLGECKEEVMMVFFLNVKNMLIQTKILNWGTLDQVSVFPQEIARQAVDFRARNVVVCHNHPSGFVEPSAGDNAVTIDIRRALRTIRVTLLDHIIVSKYSFYSYRREDESRAPQFRLLEPLTTNPDARTEEDSLC